MGDGRTKSANSSRGHGWVRKTLNVLFCFLLVASLVVGFGLSGTDQTRLSTFVDSVEQWQQNTEFRQVAMQYVTRGSDAMRTTPMGLRSAEWIIAIRSAPGMPKNLAVNETSRAHYENFSKGPLSAYLHLCTEVDLLNAEGKDGYLGEFEGRFGRSAEPSNEEVRAWLEGLKWEYKVVSDAGAVQSLQAAIADVEPYKPLKIRVRHINELLQPHIRAIAASLKEVPAEVEQMTPMQQYAVFDRLDTYIRKNDPELWRTKQISDVCGGIWGQVFSPPYLLLLSPYLKVAAIARWVALGLLAILIWRSYRRVKRLAQVEAAAEPAPGYTSPTRGASAQPELA